MGITYGDHLIDSGYYDITPEQEREIEAAKVRSARSRLAENLASFDAEVAFELSTEGERSDLWTEIDVNVEDLRTILACVCPHDCYRPGDCDGSCTHPEPDVYTCPQCSSRAVPHIVSGMGLRATCACGFSGGEHEFKTAAA